MGYVSASNTPTVVAQSAYGVATGGIGAAQSTGTLADGFSYSYLTFTSTGTLTVTQAGFFDYCLVGGGGGAFKIAGSFAAGGGGAGQILIGSIYLSSNQTITIGAGGSFFTYNTGGFTEGGTTSIGASSPFSVAALGNLANEKETGTAVSGNYVGGGVGSVGTPSAQTESAYIGYRSGNGVANNGASGGGGSTARGGDAPSSTAGGTGGAGFDVSAFIGGSELRKAMGGGGGGSNTGGAAATGGVAGTTTTTPNNGNVNSGGGSGGGNGNITQGNGGSGICYIRFR